LHIVGLLQQTHAEGTGCSLEGSLHQSPPNASLMDGGIDDNGADSPDQSRSLRKLNPMMRPWLSLDSATIEKIDGLVMKFATRRVALSTEGKFVGNPWRSLNTRNPS
jgi:hypothetical protein